MSEERVKYTLESDTEKHDGSYFRSLPSALPYGNENYRPPEPAEIAALAAYAGWSQSDLAKLVGVNYKAGKGSTTVRKWKAPKTSSEHREIPYSAWRLMLLEAGIVELETK